MELLPAIDLQNGQCVRLTQGDFNAATAYEADPLRQAHKFAEAGAKWAHVVDLDGARAGEIKQLNIIAALARQKMIKIQVGGGIRGEEDIERLLLAGVARVVVGSLAIRNPLQVREILNRFGFDRVVLAFDVRLNEQGEPNVLTHGWQKSSEVSLWDILSLYSESDAKNILCTDVGRDGMLEGPNLSLYKTLRERWPQFDIQASGGVKDQADLLALAELGVGGAIVGKAIYEGHIDLAEAVKALAA